MLNISSATYTLLDLRRPTRAETIAGAAAARRAPRDRDACLPIDADADETVSLKNVSGRTSVVSSAVDDVTLVVATNGTTSRPKRVPLTRAKQPISGRKSRGGT
jgi:hypothetical protein